MYVAMHICDRKRDMVTQIDNIADPRAPEDLDTPSTIHAMRKRSFEFRLIEGAARRKAEPLVRRGDATQQPTCTAIVRNRYIKLQRRRQRIKATNALEAAECLWVERDGARFSERRHSPLENNRAHPFLTKQPRHHHADRPSTDDRNIGMRGPDFRLD